MSVYYSAEIVVGLPYTEVDKDFKKKVLEDQFYPHVTDLSPYYDGDGTGLFGIAVRDSGDYSWIEIEDLADLDYDIQAAKRTFNEQTGLHGKVYLTTLGY